MTSGRFNPRTLSDISAAIKAVGGQPLKAVGGRWLFSDASLPLRTQQEIDRISILQRGAHGTEDFSHVLEGLNDVTNSPADLQPENVTGDLALSTHYDQPSLTRLVDSGPNLPFVDNVFLIDTHGLASSVQPQLYSVLSDAAPAAQVMWIDADGDHLLINTEVHRRKFRNVLADPRVTVTIWQADNPYEYAEIRGVVDGIVRGGPAREHIDRLAIRYFGRLYDPEQIESERVILRIRPLPDGPWCRVTGASSSAFWAGFCGYQPVRSTSTGR